MRKCENHFAKNVSFQNYFSVTVKPISLFSFKKIMGAFWKNFKKVKNNASEILYLGKSAHLAISNFNLEMIIVHKTISYILRK